MADEAPLSSAEIAEIIAEFIQRQLLADPEATVDLDDNLLTSGTVDSVGVVRLTAFLNERFQVTVPPQDLTPDNFRTVRVMADYLHGLMQA